ncbi:Crp/Fnr family transcriptional regulator [Rhizobium sp. YIM 134829]|uniref:Crp/Fnr family transcriptional regulator n=1 Tax=Rhizobium sp. YIM 134829 TaxID=3390453 RepID=UPI00397BA09C
MLRSTTFTSSNSLLGLLSQITRDRLESSLEAVDLAAGDRLAALGTPPEFLYFLESGIASSSIMSESRYESSVAMVGREGVVCGPALFSGAISAFDVTMQVAGKGLRIKSKRLRALADENPSLALLFIKFSDANASQMASTAVSGAAQRMDGRIARLLLMFQDRTKRDEIEITHGRLASMLAVRRSGITDMLNLFEGEHLIRSRRGMVTIRDRRGLRELAGAMYGGAEAYYAAVLGTDEDRAASRNDLDLLTVMPRDDSGNGEHL